MKVYSVVALVIEDNPLDRGAYCVGVFATEEEAVNAVKKCIETDFEIYDDLEVISESEWYYELDNHSDTTIEYSINSHEV